MSVNAAHIPKRVGESCSYDNGVDEGPLHHHARVGEIRVRAALVKGCDEIAMRNPEVEDQAAVEGGEQGAQDHLLDEGCDVVGGVVCVLGAEDVADKDERKHNAVESDVETDHDDPLVHRLQQWCMHSFCARGRCEKQKP